MNQIKNNRKFEKAHLIEEMDSWIQDLKDSKDVKREQIKYTFNLKNRFERELSASLTLKQIEDVFSSLSDSNLAKSDDNLYKQTSLIISQLNPDEDPILIAKEYFRFCENKYKSANDFADARNYTNKQVSLKANPASLDEAASAVESKIFKSNEKDDDSSEDSDLI